MVVQELELYDNQITTIENLDGLVNLRMLDVSHNRLR
jgi:Leucine-rich repeat (LRR) protein